MKQFNLLNEIIVTSKKDLLNAINSSREFAITIDGEIIFEPFNKIVIYKAKHSPKPINALTPTQNSSSLDKLMPKEYQVVEDKDRVLIKAGGAWQSIIDLNLENASYDDTSAEGVNEFADNELEKIGWYATDFDIKYRELVEILEESCDGTLLCIEKEEPYHFSGLGFIKDNAKAREILFNKVKNIIKNKIETDEDYALDELDKDQIKAAKFFELI